jgi:tetratricopeptide (TPR) repeat protein
MVVSDPQREERVPMSEEYDREWRLAVEASEAGRLEEARAHLAASLVVAEGLGDEELVERAFCNHATLAIALGEGDDAIPRLCAIVLRNRSLTNAFLAANNVARACELKRDNRKGLLYARIARDRAAALGRADWLAAANNQIANLLLADSYFAEAAATYQQALALVPAEDSSRQLTYLANLAYCELVLGRARNGLSILYRCLRAARQHGWTRLEMIARIDLCYAHLELGRLEHAERHGRRGLVLAERTGERDWVKNALYLLGEVAVLGGASNRAYARFQELQRRFYPTQPHLPDFLLSVDVRKLINLRA